MNCRQTGCLATLLVGGGEMSSGAHFADIFNDYAYALGVMSENFG